MRSSSEPAEPGRVGLLTATSSAPLVALAAAGLAQHGLQRGVERGLLLFSALVTLRVGWRELRRRWGRGPDELQDRLLLWPATVAAAAGVVVYPLPLWVSWGFLLACLLTPLFLWFARPPESGKAPSRRRLAFVGFAALGSLVLAELAGQVLCVVLLPRRLPVVSCADPDLGWVPVRGERVNPNGVRLRFNSLGLRGPELAPGPRDLLFVGDSVTMAQQVPEEETFVARTGGVNGGVDGYTTFQELDRFRRDLKPLKFRRLVLVVCVNDIFSREVSRRLMLLTMRYNSTLERTEAWRTWLQREAFYRLYLEIMRRRNEPPEEVQDARYLAKTTEAYPPETWAEWTGAIRALREAHGGPFGIVLSPARPQVAARRAGRERFWLDDHLRAFAAREGIPFLDLLPAFAAAPAGASLFVDHVHLSARGHEVAAEALRPFLRQVR